MNKKALQRLLMTAILCLPAIAMAQAPVVDDSENYALLDEQQNVQESASVRQEPAAEDSQAGDEEQPLAKEDLSTSAIVDNAELIDKLQAMRQEIQELRGQVEVLTHDLKKLQQQQLTFYKDLDARIRNGQANAGVATEQGSAQAEDTTEAQAITTSATRLNPADEQISYLAAYELVKGKRYDEALQAMQAFVKHYPNGGYAANAQYWLGELYMVKSNYPEAIKHFQIVLNQFPKSSKAAASTLKIGYALAASGKENEARKRLQEVIRHYPDTPTAQLAKTKLRLLNAR